jgi:cell wall-associated NlpC family hydrolase
MSRPFSKDHLTRQPNWLIFEFMKIGKAVGVAIGAMSLMGCATTVVLIPDSPAAYSAKKPHLAAARQSVVETALSLLGTPYRYGGASRRGFDCSGLLKYVYKESVGIKIPRHSRAQARTGKPVSPSKLAPADILLFKIKGQKSLHIGMYIGNGKFIHAPSSGGKVNIQKLKAKYWKRSLRGARRVLI